jgi:hypothetical protein
LRERRPLRIPPRPALLRRAPKKTGPPIPFAQQPNRRHQRWVHTRKDKPQGLSEIVRPGLDKALFTQASDQCGIAFAGRKQRPWMLNGMLAVDLEIRGDQAVVGEVFFPPEHEGSVGDEAFRTCLRDVVAGARFECVRCKPGTLTVPYPVNLRTYRSSYPDAGP